MKEYDSKKHKKTKCCLAKYEDNVENRGETGGRFEAPFVKVHKK